MNILISTQINISPRFKSESILIVAISASHWIKCNNSVSARDFDEFKTDVDQSRA
jgi:hypothetical protein